MSEDSGPGSAVALDSHEATGIILPGWPPVGRKQDCHSPFLPTLSSGPGQRKSSVRRLLRVAPPVGHQAGPVKSPKEVRGGGWPSGRIEGRRSEQLTTQWSGL